ncbi:MAG: IS4 family transposase [Betaproteobacteria bacterium]
MDAAWIEQALKASGTASIRHRKLPAEHVVWLVIGMAMLRDRCIAEVVRHLDLVLPTPAGKRQHVSNSALVQARDRLGAEPLGWLFHTSAAVWASASADEHRWRGLAVLGVDGSTLRVPDTPQNDAHFGRAGTSRGDALAAYPQLRLVTLMVLRSHLLLEVAFGPYRKSELALARELWPRIPKQSLLIMDREFANYENFQALSDPTQQRHWLTRAKAGERMPKLHAVEKLGRNDALVELRPSPMTRQLHPGSRTRREFPALQDPRTHRSRVLGTRHRLQPGAPHHGEAHPNQLSPHTALRTRLLDQCLACQPRRPAQTPAGPLRRIAPLALARTTTSQLSSRRQNQDEQLPQKAAAGPRQ